MKKFLLTLPLIIIIFSFVVAPYALAQCYCYCGNYFIGEMKQEDCEKIGTCGEDAAGHCGSGPSGAGGQISLKDPLNLGGDATKLYARLITALLAFVGVASLVTFVYAGFMFLISAGNPERVKKAKDTMFYSVLGVILAIASYAILSFIFKILEGATGQLPLAR